MPAATNTPIVLDIPAQPLASALDAYSAATGKEVFYDGTTGGGRRSAAVKGTFMPRSALTALLAGTGFVALPGGPDDYTLVYAPEQAAHAEAAVRIAADRPYAHYFAVVQTDVRNALCRRPETRPGSYRLVLKFWIGPSGAVERSELTGSTGSPAADGLLVQTFRILRLDEPPPPDMPQPITMAVLPQAAGAAACPPTDAAAVVR
jgi:TonB family protein